MSINKNWTQLRNRLCREYRNGVKAFIERAQNYLSSYGKARCPCRDCCNCYWHFLDEIEDHLLDRGMQESYKTRAWVYHGETFDNIVVEGENEGIDMVTDQNDNFYDLLHDVAGSSYVHLENDDDPDVASPSIPIGGTDHGKFDNFFDDMKQPLYPGCETFSALTFLVKLMHVKVLNKWSNKSFDMLLKFLIEALPKGTKLPESHYEAKSYLSALGLGYESIHACKFDCALFWKENAELEACPICHTSRWVDKDTKGKKIPHKVLRYFRLKPRLQRLYQSSRTAKDMMWHDVGRQKTDGVLRHPADAEEWQNFDKMYPDFAKEPRNVRLALASDGFNPFGNMSNAYSMWPVVLVPYNMPLWRCMKESSFIMSLLIPGRNAPGKDIDVYLQPLIDELNELWEEGAKTFDFEKKEYFQMHAALLWTINDFPAYGNLSGWTTKGYMACPICNKDTVSSWVRGKVSYTGHRCYLKISDPMRKNKQINGLVEMRTAPKIRNGEDILKQLEHVNVVPGKHPSFGGKKRKRGSLQLNWSKKSIFFELPYWSKLELRHNLDVMHIEKNICDSVVGTLLNIDGKSKDTDKARLDLEDMGVRKELHLQLFGDKWVKPHAVYTLTKNERRQFCEFLKSVKFPDGFAANIGKTVNVAEGKLSGLKSHDCHVLMQHLLAIGIRPYMTKEVRGTITELTNFFKELCSRTLKVKDLEALEKGITNVLCKLERIYPPAFFDAMLHLPIHLPREARLGGPVHARWMYPFERFMGTLKKYVRNKARPEGSIAEGYIVNEALTFCSMYFDGIETRFNRRERNYDQPERSVEQKLSVFQHAGRPLGKKEIIQLDNELQKEAHWFILNNCPEIKKYRDEHMLELKKRLRRNLFTTHKEEFPSWFRKRISSFEECSDELFYLSCRPDVSVGCYSGCIVNGVKFLTKERDSRRMTQNCGISVLGSDDGTQPDFLGVLDQVFEFTYVKNDYRVLLFKCKWFDTDVTTRSENIVYEKYCTTLRSDKEWYKKEPFIFASQARQVFYTNDPLKHDPWQIVQKFSHRHLWDIAEVDEDDVLQDDVLQGDSSSSRITFEGPEMEALLVHRDDVEPEICHTNIDNVRRPSFNVDDSFIVDEVDETLEEYNDEVIEHSENDYDSDD